MRSLPRVALLVIAGSAVALWLVKERAETSIPLDIERAIRSLRLEPHADAREVQASAEGFRYAAGGFEIRFDRGEPAVLAQPNQGPAMRMRAVGRFEPASARDGAVCYASADAQSALLYRPARFGVKEDLILLNRKSFGAGLFQWMLELPSQLDARMAEDGGIEFHDRCRKPGVTLRAARIPPPVARDAAGGALPARFEWTRPYLNVRVGLPDAAVFPVTVDPTLVLPSDSDFPIDGNDEGLIRYETNEIHRDGVRGWQIPSWLPAGSFATGRSGHGCAVYNGFLTVVGGDFLSDVQKAPINPDGSVGAFTATTAVPGEPRSGAGVVAHNGFLYVIGGENASGVVLADVRYARLNDDGTISPGAWQMGAPLPGGGRSQFVCAAVDNHVYVVSGIGLGGATTDVLKSTIRPDGSLGGWSLMSSTTAFRRNAGGFVHDGHIYAMGGNNGSFELDSVEYARIKPDGALSAWMATRALPRAREGARAACVNGYAFVVGGKQTPTSVIAAPVLAGGGLGPWIGTASLSEGRASAAAVGYNGRVFVVGGSGSNSVVSGLPEGGHVGGWSTLSSLPTGRALHGAATYGGVVTVTGGTDLSIAGLTSVQYSAIGADGALGAWSDTTPLPGARYYHATVAYDSFLYAVGGETGVGAAQTFYKTVYVASMSATGSLGAWSSAEDLPLNRSRMGVHVYNGRMYAVGGVVNVGLLTQITNTVVAANVDPSGGGVTGWAAATSLPEARSRHASVLYAGRLYVIGGEGVAGSLNDVRFAQIKADGSLSAWSAPMPLPQSVVDGSAIAMHGTLYVYSGSAMLSAPINQDGTLGAFTSTAPPPTSRSGARMVAHSGVVYVTGGTSGGAVESDMSVVEGGGVTTHGTVSGWTTTTQMPATLASHAAAAYDGYVYVTGGFSGGFLNDVRYAPVNPDGTIGAWTATNSFAGPRAGHACVAHRGYLYVIGGRDGGGDLTDVQKAPIQPDGSVGTWEVLSSLIIERHDHAVAVYGEFLYAIGGTTALDEVEFASINPDGTLGAWSGTTALPTGRWDHASVAYNGYLYALGGSDGADRLREAQVAPINVDGTLGPWQPTTGLPLAREAHAAVVENGYVYVLGGSRAAGDTSNAVLSAPIHGDGSLGEWTFTQPLAQKRSAHAAVVHAGCAYVLGGKTGLVPATDTVQFARLRTPNARGVYSRRIDLGATLNVVSLLTMGGGSNGQARVAVRLAPEGSDWGDASVIDPLPWGTPVTLSGVGRYLHLRYTLDDTSAVVVNADAPAHLAVGGITIESDSAPGVPASAEQFQSDGLTAIPVGGGASTATVVFKATLSDADPGDVIRLHVEVQPVGVPFTDSPTASSGFVPSGTLASVPVGGLTPGWEYHWQCWAEDSAGVVSTFFDYGGNSVDFFIDRPPDVPGAMGQFESDGVTPIPDGGTSGSSTVVFEAVLADPDSGSQVKLQLELKPQGVPFTDTASFESALGAPGTSVGITVSGLALGGYHWQMCCVDDLGLASAWTPFSGADPNFIVGSANGAPGAPGVPAQLQSDGATLIPLGGQAATSVVIVRGDATDPDGGDVVKLQVELRPTDTGFSSPASPIIDGVAFFESSLGAQGTHFVSLAIPGDGSYHWQARAVDGAGAASAWTPYGNNGDTPPAGIDFVLDLINDPPAIDGSTVGQFLPDGVTPIAVGGGAANG
ncbi:MAG: hypothetical protein HYY16_06140, partial [Planctomycetes bacterium]|nr:hypothetical protein [Planctomycetota bacterium]